MIIEDEPGPVEKIELARFPVASGNRRVFETLAAQAGRDLERHADAIGATAHEIRPMATRDINSDFARTVPGAVAEINGQLSSQSQIDPGPMYAAALESIGDLTGAGAGLPPAGATSGGVTGGGGSEFGVVQWAEHGASAPGPAPRPPSGPGPSPSPQPGDPDHPSPEPAPGEPGPEPPPPPAPGEPAPLPPGEPSPPPPEDPQPLI